MTAEIQTRPGPASRGEPAELKKRGLRRRSRLGWRSPLTRRILLLNLLVLLIPVLGLMHLEQYRDSLIAAELEGLRTQGRSFALSLGSTAVVANNAGVERLLPELTRHLMRLLLTNSTTRARAFALDGKLLADSFVLM
ncbi:MAG: sensor N-terminal transmembrane domain-containing protein, partial [Rhodospirillales bacterium]|nr:sensor N-terminal transmembrane domain-containing protein [Rhodospirillales bacterium]